MTAVSVNFGPKTQVLNQVYMITANTHTNAVNLASKSIPAKLLNEKQQGAMTGPTTGKSNCLFGIIACQQSVADTDVSDLARQIHTNLMPKLTQDLRGKIIAANGTQVGVISFLDSSPVANPPVGTISNNVTVTLVEQATVGYIVKGDAQELARQLLKQQVSQNYRLINSTINVGDPVIEGVDSSGVVTIKIAAGGVELYSFPPSQLQNIQQHLVGLTVRSAQTYIGQQPGIDPKTIAIHFTEGSSSTLPSDAQRIHLVNIAPTTYPSFNLQSIPTPTTTPTSVPTTNP
jgi:hypothetical protein